uniref:Uncharacterized protein n=1 Tax=Rhizophora mucronata TaxID=61149 RepID=A0A2P2KQ41_RHIMU
MIEIAALSLIAPLLYVLHHAICYHYKTDSLAKRTSSKKDDNDDATVSSKDWWTYMTTITMDFLSTVLPMLLFFTVLAQWTFITAIVLSLLVFSIAAKR